MRYFMAVALALTWSLPAVADSAPASVGIPPGQSILVAVTDGPGMVGYRICLPQGGRIQVEFGERGAWPVKQAAGKGTFDDGTLGHNCRDYALGGRSRLSVTNPGNNQVQISLQVIH